MGSIKIVFGVVAISVLISGCASSKSAPTSRTVDHARILEAIDKSAKVIAEAQRVSAESQNAMRSASMTEQQREEYKAAMGYVPPNMERPISFFAKNQELEKSVELLAMLTNYDFNVVNPSSRPNGGVLVTVESKGRAAFDVARDLGTQAGIKADVKVMPYPSTNRKTSKFGLIEVEYK